jgi:NAD(P)-dependent dehydrogenase (short-subunit alcohol dehydrogenase family)
MRSAPGLIRTPLTDKYFSQSGYLKEYFRHIAMGRGGEPQEVANAIAFLASDLASYITGADSRGGWRPVDVEVFHLG